MGEEPASVLSAISSVGERKLSLEKGHACAAWGNLRCSFVRITYCPSPSLEGPWGPHFSTVCSPCQQCAVHHGRATPCQYFRLESLASWYLACVLIGMCFLSVTLFS
ncbi:unnamed protein product [Discosporangium mesarthrocarpum]